MALSTLCRLCLCICQNDYKGLIRDDGSCSEAYEIAIKYFDPMLLISGQEHHQIICSVCWQHIQDFYIFQQTVYKNHSELELKEVVSSVKVEAGNTNDKPNISTDNQLHKEPKNETDLAAIQSYILDKNDSFSSEDERPLIESFQKSREKQFLKQKLKKNNETKEKSVHVHKDQIDHKIKLELVSNSRLLDSNFNICRGGAKLDTQQKTLENDAFIAAWRSELDCVKCKEKFVNFTLLRKHFLKHHSDEKCFIICCGRKFRSRYHIVEHVKLHINPNAYRCEVCGKCSTNSRNLAKHMKELHSEEGKQRSLKCPTCLKVLANKNSLRVHMETHETNLSYICRECGKGFPSEQKRTLHERNVHKATLICDQCGKNLHNHYSMKQHLQQHAGVEKRKWPCDMCSAELNSRSSLKRHKQIIHQDGSTVYVCSVCGKNATTEVALLRHKRNVHLPGRNHKCTLCDKAFKFPRVLREHMATHTGEDIYRCPHCERTFKTNANMHHHRKKAHHKEWVKGRLKRSQVAKVNFNSVQHEVVI